MAERMKNGNISAAPASVISDSASAPESLKRIRNTSEFFRKLSLNALKNWHQKRGAKRGVFIKVVNMLVQCADQGASVERHRRSRREHIWKRSRTRSVAPGETTGPLTDLNRSGSGPLALKFHQNPFGLGVLEPVYQLAALVHVAQRLGHRDAGLDQQCRAHGKIGFHP